jgi:uncharacterized RDD family membrane protein YckC
VTTPEATAAMVAPDPATLPAAGLDRRFYAFVIDRMVAWTVVGLVAWGAYQLLVTRGGLGAGLLIVLGALLLVGFAFALVLGTLGTSPGKSALGLRAVQATSGAPIGVLPALQRTLILGVATLPTFGLGVATLAWTAVSDPGGRRRGWHDLVTGSVVVDVRPVPEPPVEEEPAPRQVVNLTAMRLVPSTSASPEDPIVHDRDVPQVARWRVSFDTGESLVVEGVALVGRRPEPRAGEEVRHVVPLRSDDMSLSKTHAQFQVAPDGMLVVMDRGSTNGSVLIRGRLAKDLPAGKPTTLLPGDQVAFGDRRMTVAREA